MLLFVLIGNKSFADGEDSPFLEYAIQSEVPSIDDPQKGNRR